jgi:hypothetical protein
VSAVVSGYRLRLSINGTGTGPDASPGTEKLTEPS